MKTPTRTRPASAAKKEPVARVMFTESDFALGHERDAYSLWTPEAVAGTHWGKPVLVIDLSRKEEVVEVMMKAIQQWNVSRYDSAEYSEAILTALERAAVSVKGRGRK